VANPKCPRCGSANTARYLYGMPAFSEELEKKLNAGTVVLGGCMIHERQPRFLCNACKRSFGATAFTKDGSELIPLISSISFSVGGFFDGYTQIEFRRTAGGAEYAVSDRFTSSEVRTMPDKEWTELVDRLYNHLFLDDWKRRYVDEGVLDGTQWELTVQLDKKRKREYYGSNMYPAYWKRLNKLFQPYMTEAEIPMDDKGAEGE
jgi:hypothetical protein